MFWRHADTCPIGTLDVVQIGGILSFMAALPMQASKVILAKL